MPMKKVFYTSLFWIVVVGWFALYMKRFNQDLWNKISNFIVDADDVVITTETGNITSEVADLPLILTWKVDDQYTVLLEKIDLLQEQIMLIQKSLVAPEKITTPIVEEKTTSTNPTLDEIQKRLELLEKNK